MRDRGRETFILVSDIIYHSPKYVGFASTELSFNIADKMPIFNRYVEEVMESTNLLEPIQGLDQMIDEDPRLADHLKYDVAERLVKILKESDDVFIQRSAAYILSQTKFDTIIREKAIPVLVNLMRSQSYIIAVPVVITLTRLACFSPNYVRVILDEGAFEVALELARIKNRGHMMLDNLAKFMAVVCRGTLLPDKLLPFWKSYFKEDRALPSIYKEHAMHFHIFLMEDVEIRQETCERLMRLSTHSDNSVVGSALGVLGNIARWGTFDQIEILAKDSEFLQYLGTTLLCCKPKKFQLEASQIISKIAAQSRTLTEDLDSVCLIDRLNGLLKVDESDVKMEAGCTISEASLHVYQKLLSQEIR